MPLRSFGVFKSLYCVKEGFVVWNEDDAEAGKAESSHKFASGKQITFCLDENWN